MLNLYSVHQFDTDMAVTHATVHISTLGLVTELVAGYLARFSVDQHAPCVRPLRAIDVHEHQADGMVGQIHLNTFQAKR